MKKNLPKHFYNVDLKSDIEYKKFDDKCWWNSLDKNKRKEYVDKYGSKEFTYQRRHRFTQSLGYCKKYKIIDETFFK